MDRPTGRFSFVAQLTLLRRGRGAEAPLRLFGALDRDGEFFITDRRARLTPSIRAIRGRLRQIGDDLVGRVEGPRRSDRLHESLPTCIGGRDVRGRHRLLPVRSVWNRLIASKRKRGERADDHDQDAESENTHESIWSRRPSPTEPWDTSFVRESEQHASCIGNGSDGTREKSILHPVDGGPIWICRRSFGVSPSIGIAGATRPELFSSDFFARGILRPGAGRRGETDVGHSAGEEAPSSILPTSLLRFLIASVPVIVPTVR